MISTGSQDTSVKVWPAHVAPGTEKAIIDSVKKMMKGAGFKVSQDDISLTISR